MAETVMILLLLGLVAYVVLGGADFGAGVWYVLLPGEGRRKLRDHTYHAMGPVWEANHVWLIFVLVVAWTGFPSAFGSIASSLYIPLFIAAIGIILRGTTYALRGWARNRREERIVGLIFGISSFLTPFALGAAIGGIASERVPVGNAAAEPWSSWLNPTSILIGFLSIATSAYLAAVWLTADAKRADRPDLVEAFRRRALVMGTVAGALAIGGLFVLKSDAERVFNGLTSGAGLAAVVASALAGVATIFWDARGRFETARWSAAFAVGFIVAGWAIAQQPQILPGLTVDEAAADHDTLVALLIAIALGAFVLVPSLWLLFGMVLHGQFDERPEKPGSLAGVGEGREITGPLVTPPGRSAGVLAAVLAVVGVPLMFFSDGGVTLAVGVIFVLGALVAAGAFFLPGVAEQT
jgi:cytochrome bd ubiquinol oxidase subunit II